jgi:hypothetical protein
MRVEDLNHMELLASRLARDHQDRTVIPLKRSLCPNMFRISPDFESLCQA